MAQCKLKWMILGVINRVSGVQKGRVATTLIEEPALKNVKEQHSQPSAADRPWGIWIWNLLITRAEIERQLACFVEKGFGGVAVRPSRDMNPRFMSEEFMQLFRRVLEIAKDKGIGIALATDFSMPWNTGLEPLMAAETHLRAQVLSLESEELVAGKTAIERTVADPSKALAFAIRQQGTRSVASDVHVLNVSKGSLTWKAPAGDWKVIVLRKKYSADPTGGYFANVLESRTAHAYIQTVLETLKTRFSSFSPSTFRGIITELPGVIPVDNTIPWDEDLIVKYRAKFKKELVKSLPALFTETEDNSNRHRSHVYTFLGQAMYERFASILESWAKKGHWFHWVLCPERTVYRSANIMRGYFAFAESTLSVTGIQNQDGSEEGAAFGRALADLNAVEFRRETVAVVGRNRQGNAPTLQSLKNEIDEAVLSGASRLLVDGNYFNLDQRSYIRSPQGQFWYSPDWENMARLTTYAARLTAARRNLHLERPVAVLLPASSSMADYMPGNDEIHRRAVNAFVKTVTRLKEAGIDFDVISESFLLGCTVRETGEFGPATKVRKGNYQALVVPYSRLAPKGLLAYLERLAVRKGTILFVDEPPQGDLEDGMSKNFTDRVEKLMGTKRGIVKTVPTDELGSLLADTNSLVRVTVGGKKTHDFTAIRSVGTATATYFIRNGSAKQDYLATIDVPADKHFMIHSSETGDMIDVTNVEHADGRSVFHLYFAPGQTQVIVASHSKQTATIKTKDLVPGSQTGRNYRVVLRDQWNFEPGSVNVLPLTTWNKRIGLSRDSGGYSHYYESVFLVKDTPGQCLLMLNGLAAQQADLSAIDVTVNGNKVHLVVNGHNGLVADPVAEAAAMVQSVGYLANSLVYDLRNVVNRGPNRVTIRSIGFLSHPTAVIYPPVVVGNFSVVKGQNGLMISLPGNTCGYQSWTEFGYPCLSGKGVFKHVFEVPSSYTQLVLRLSEVTGSVDVAINGNPVGHLCWHPMQLDITKFCQSKRNELQLTVHNTIDNMIRMNNRESGLIGEVFLDVY